MAAANRQPAEHLWETLRNRIWASRVVYESGLSAGKISLRYPRTTAGRCSSQFKKTLARGRPSPRVILEDGSEGPVLLIEREFPGSLHWLNHPIWTTLRSLEVPPIPHGLTIARCFQNIAGCVVFEHLKDDERHLEAKLKLLKKIGTLDSLTALLLLAQQMYLTARSDDFLSLRKFADSQVSLWACLSWLSEELKHEFCRFFLHRLASCEPTALPSIEEAQYEMTLLSLMSLGEKNLSHEDVQHITKRLYPPST